MDTVSHRMASHCRRTNFDRDPKSNHSQHMDDTEKVIH